MLIFDRSILNLYLQSDSSKTELRLMKILRKVLCISSLLIASSAIHADSILPITLSDIHVCTFSEGEVRDIRTKLKDPDKRSKAMEEGKWELIYGEVISFLDEEIANQRYPFTKVIDRKELEHLGFKLNHDNPFITTGERTLDNGLKELVYFSLNSKLSFNIKNGHLDEVVSFDCTNPEVSYFKEQTKASLNTKYGPSLIPKEFLVEKDMEFKFDLKCYDDWDDVVYSANKVRASSKYEFWSEGKDETYIAFVYYGIRVDRDHSLKAVKDLYELEDKIEFCDLSNVKKRPN